MKITCIFDFTLLLTILAFGRNDHKLQENEGNDYPCLFKYSTK